MFPWFKKVVEGPQVFCFTVYKIRGRCVLYGVQNIFIKRFFIVEKYLYF